jgi:chorismate dehydratase
LFIGDRAFKQRRLSTYIYDLAAKWKAMTGLLFVFAVWVSVKLVKDECVQQFNDPNAVGLGNLEDIAEGQKCSAFDLRIYYAHHIAYRLTNECLKGMERFLEMMIF